MFARAFFALALGAGASACMGLPDVAFYSDDASTGAADGAALFDGAAPTLDATTTADATMNDDAPSGADATDSSAIDSGLDASLDASLDSGLVCPPDGAPPGTQCCPNGVPCIGPACAHCDTCSCAVGLYCCAVENNGGHVQGTTCSNMPTSSQCPTQ